MPSPPSFSSDPENTMQTSSRCPSFIFFFEPAHVKLSMAECLHPPSPDSSPRSHHGRRLCRSLIKSASCPSLLPIVAGLRPPSHGASSPQHLSSSHLPPPGPLSSVTVASHVAGDITVETPQSSSHSTDVGHLSTPLPVHHRATFAKLSLSQVAGPILTSFSFHSLSIPGCAAAFHRATAVQSGHLLLSQPSSSFLWCPVAFPKLKPQVSCCPLVDAGQSSPPCSPPRRAHSLLLTMSSIPA